MLFWGWGSKALQRVISHEQAVVRRFRYFHLMWLFQFSWGGTYLLATSTPQGIATREISEVEARTLLGGEALEPNLWQRFGLLFGLGALTVATVISAAFSH